MSDTIQWIPCIISEHAAERKRFHAGGCDNGRYGLSGEPGGPGVPATMLRVLSTHIFLNQRLHPGLLEHAGRAGAEAIEIFAARQHFDYTSREHVRELCDWFRSNPVKPFSMHAPLFPDYEMGRAGAPAVNLIHPEKSRRIDAMDEIKRALEAAEQIPFKHLIIHLGEREDGWSQRTIDNALTALEHLGAFARALGVKLLAENLTNAPTTPEHLMTILDLGHLDNVGVCLDLGHANITVGVPEAIGVLGARIQSLHVHDNHGMKDEHLWPGEGGIDWPTTAKLLHALPTPPAAVLEIATLPGEAPIDLHAHMQRAFEKLA